MKYDSRQDSFSSSQSQELVVESYESSTVYIANDRMILVFKGFSVPSSKPSVREKQLEAKVELLESQVAECLQILKEQNSSLIDQLQEAKSAACWFDSDSSVTDYLESLSTEDG